MESFSGYETLFACACELDEIPRTNAERSCSAKTVQKARPNSRKFRQDDFASARKRTRFPPLFGEVSFLEIPGSQFGASAGRSRLRWSGDRRNPLHRQSNGFVRF